MATTVLYPPIVDTYMPAFLINKTDKTGICRIYFAISKYNALGDANKNGNHDDNEIYSIWVSLTNQYTNAPLLDTNLYKSGLKSVNANKIQVDPNRQGDDKYFIEISASDLTAKKWDLRETYKVQLRFCKKYVDETTESNTHMTNSMSSVSQNLTYFSEWSTVCLLQGILQPEIQLNGFSATEEVVFGSTDNQITGEIVFDIEENDYVNYYRLQLFNASDLKIALYDSGNIYTHSQAYNEINHTMKYGLEDGVRYILKVSYATNKMYENFAEFQFLVLDINVDTLNANIIAAPEDDLGRVKLHLKSKDVTKTIFGNVIIRRTSNRSNFMVWEDIKVVTLNNELLDVTWYDYTIESGVWYKYCIQKRDVYGHRGVAVITKNPVMCLFHDMFLVGENQQLKIKFNPQINNFNHTLLESSTQTIGSQYPFIKRNGNVNYRQFGISGLISHFMDEEELFVSQENLYDGTIELYENYNEHNKITKYNDIVLEKKFRDKVQEFLYDGKPKLFKSNTEGTILIRLMNTSFTPEQTLSRMLYTFNSTAYEIDDYSLENIEKYNIQSIGELQIVKNTNNKEISFTSTNMADLKNIVADTELLSLRDVVTAREADSAIQGITFAIDYFTDVNLQFTSEPYLILIKDNSLIKAKASEESFYTAQEYLTTGYIIEVDGVDTLVPESGKYSISNTKITDIQIVDANSQFSASCNYVITQQEDVNTIPAILLYSQIAGHEDGFYYNTNNIIQDFIVAKYINNNGSQYQKLYSIDDLVLEGEPNTVIYLQTSFDDNYYRVILNETGHLNLSNSDYIFTGMYVAGLHLNEKKKDTNSQYLNYEISDLEFKKDMSLLYNDITQIKNPERNTVYHVSNLYGVELFNQNIDMANNNYINEYKSWHESDTGYYSVIYYYNKWYLFNEYNDIVLPMYLSCTYNGEIEKGEFIA